MISRSTTSQECLKNPTVVAIIIRTFRAMNGEHDLFHIVRCRSVDGRLTTSDLWIRTTRSQQHLINNNYIIVNYPLPCGYCIDTPLVYLFTVFITFSVNNKACLRLKTSTVSLMNNFWELARLSSVWSL